MAKTPKDSLRTRAAAAQPVATSKAVAAAAMATPLGKLAQDRRSAAVRRKSEIKRLRREYDDAMRVLEEAGGEASVGMRAFAADSAPKPLRIFAEGDSWFDYPVPFSDGGIIPRLAKKLGVSILNLAKAGDEVRFMLGVEQRELIAEEFQRANQAGKPWDVLLFSGGGNDVTDKPMVLWLRDYVAGRNPKDQIYLERYGAILALVHAGYEDLIALRDRLSPETHLVFHTYDFALPDGRGVCGFGPWLQPSFKARGFPSDRTTEAAEVVKVMLAEFAKMLGNLAASSRRVTVINGQGTLQPRKKSWDNELHPSSKGFDAFADRFYTELKLLFPERVASRE
jgi:hypothetical protein